MAEALSPQKDLPAGGEENRPAGWWGMWALIVTEASLFGYLLFAYFYLDAQSEQRWPPEGAPDLSMPGLNTALLLASSACVWLSERGIRRGRRGRCMGFMALAVALGAAFAAIQWHEWRGKDYGPASGLYGSLYFTITGFHMLHVVIGLFIISLLLLWTKLGCFDEGRHGALSVGGLYWHFVDAVWVVIFTSLFLAPCLSRGAP